MNRFAPAILGTFFSFASLICFVVSLTFFAPNGPFSTIWRVKPAEYQQMLAFGQIVAWGFLALAILMAAAAIGTFRCLRRGWQLAVAIFCVNLISDVARLVSGDWREGLIGLVIVGVILVWMIQPGVKSRFAG